MNLALAIYLVDMFAPPEGFLGATVLFGGAVMILVAVGVSLSQEDSHRTDKDQDPLHLTNKHLKLTGKFFLLVIIYGLVVPTKETAYKMIAAYGVTESYENEKVKNVVDKSVELLETTIDKYIQEDKSE